jgi:hypothetical protein
VTRRTAAALLRILCLAALCELSAVVFAADEEAEPPLAPPEANEKAAGAEPAPGFSLGRLGITGSLRAAYWSSNRRQDSDEDIGVVSSWLKLDKRLESGIGLFAEGYLANEDAFGKQRDVSWLREAYFEGRKGKFDYRLGKQIIAWGRTDRLNPTDNLTPRDFSLLAADIDEDRFGSVAAKGLWSFDSYTSFTAAWIPEFRPNKIALPARPGIAFDERVPESRRQWAVKLDQSGKAVDWSVSWFDGFDLSADLSPGATPGVVLLDHHRTRVLGADAATTRGSWRFALEGAYVRTEDPDGIDPGIKNPFFYGVFGIERSFTDNLTTIVQVYGRKVSHYRNPEDIAAPAARAIAIEQAIANNQYDRDQYGASARIAKKWFNETLEGELAGSLLLNRDGYSLRPRATYIWSDSIKILGGYEWYKGSDKTLFGRLEKNKTVFAEVRYFF